MMMMMTMILIGANFSSQRVCATLQTYTGFYSSKQLEKCNEERCNETIASKKDTMKKDATLRIAMRKRTYARIFIAKYDICKCHT